MSKIDFQIVKTLIIFPAEGEWHKELNLVKWNGREAKYDLRGWNADHSKMTKGATLTEEELQFLKSNL